MVEKTDDERFEERRERRLRAGDVAMLRGFSDVERAEFGALDPGHQADIMHLIGAESRTELVATIHRLEAEENRRKDKDPNFMAPGSIHEDKLRVNSLIPIEGDLNNDGDLDDPDEQEAAAQAKERGIVPSLKHEF